MYKNTYVFYRILTYINKVGIPFTYTIPLRLYIATVAILSVGHGSFLSMFMVRMAEIIIIS